MKKVTVIGGGLAGCEAAWQAARRGAEVILYEMKPQKYSEAHKESGLAELVCSNSLRSNDPGSAPGLLKEEMRMLGSLLMKAAEAAKVPAGSALAVDRVVFSDFVTSAIEANNNITIVRDELTDIPTSEDTVIVIATGPLTSDSFAQSIGSLIGEDYLYFYDAIAPIVDVDSIDFDIAFRAARYGKGDDDYINCPMDEETYYGFVEALINAEQLKTKDFEKEIFFEGCMPIEVMAGRGKDTLSFGPMKPVGLEDPRTGKCAFAVIQLRQENKSASMYNIVGFQTRMTYPEQRRVFSMIPGLENAEFLRLGSMHRNTYINSPTHLSATLQMRERPDILFAGQITGVEGYIESAATGILAGINAAKVAEGKAAVSPPELTGLGGLIRHVTDADVKHFQPMHINFGLLPPVERVKGRRMKKSERRAMAAKRAIELMEAWVNEGF